jgi:hypothetical protein
MLPALMVAPVRQASADFLKHYIHIRSCPFFDFGHVTPQGRLSLPINRRKIVAIRVRALQRNHGLNIEGHTAQVSGQSIEEVALPYVGGKFANQRAILGIGQQLFEFCR